MGRGRVLAAAAVYAAGLAVLVLSPVAHLLNRFTVKLYVLWLYTLALPGNPSPEDFGVALNVLLFVPVGALLVLASRRPWWMVALACVLVSATIEAVQALGFLGREASLVDVVANGAGGLVGSLLGAWLTRRSARRVTRRTPVGA